MDRYGFVAITFTFLFILSTSNASVAFNLRKLIMALPSNDSISSQVSPVSSPINAGDNKRIKSKPINTENSGEEKHKDDKMNIKNDNDKGVTNASQPVASAEKSDDKKEKADDSTNSQLQNDGSCEGLPNWCTDQKDMVACLEMFQNGSKTVFLVVQNKGKGSLKVNIHMLSAVGNAPTVLEIPKHQSRRIDISSTVHYSTKVTLTAGSGGECTVPLGNPVSVENFLQQLTFYSKQVPPMYGAYFLFLVLLLVGGACACCRLNKRKRQSGIPYQELEMGPPESASTTIVDTAEDWDQDWDEDWDDDGAVKSINGLHAGSISADGLTSRSSRKEGWEDDWED